VGRHLRTQRVVENFMRQSLVRVVDAMSTAQDIVKSTFKSVEGAVDHWAGITDTDSSQTVGGMSSDPSAPSITADVMGSVPHRQWHGGQRGAEQRYHHPGVQRVNNTLFAHLDSTNMLQVTQDPVTSEWTSRNIHLPPTGINDLIEYNSYTTQISPRRG
jgi:hypothetical protein